VCHGADEVTLVIPAEMPTTVSRAPVTRRTMLAWGEARLRTGGVSPDEARPEAEVLLRHVFGLSREELLLRPDAEVPAAAARAYADAVDRRAAGCPTAYLVGRREFYGMEFAVDARVLIPRPETERLVEVTVDALRGRRAPLVVDLGTGCGAIALAIARALPEACLIATDASAPALEVARANAARHGLASRVTWACGDALDALTGLGIEGRADAICANPPYVPTGEVAHLPREVRECEPRIALDGGADGLAVHRRIVAGSARYLRRGGLLGLECSALGGQARAVAALVAAAGTYAPAEIVDDHAGVERVVLARRLDRPRAASGAGADADPQG